MANKIHKGKIDGEIDQSGTVGKRLERLASDLSEAEKTAIGQKLFKPITENEFGTHPAFASQHDLNAWILGNSGGGGAEPEQLNSPDPISATSSGGDSITINWTDTNS